ncbi:hypothetical protein M6D93_03995 [Jatrophihabitans telluris]|uniref:Uncharacterized protein n=1 Tax=Jatrophihabitans telluris TaxID=2038343 RepID=A0ABY4QZS6_9ACTN|nr:hypothetical protein [Jatrophihabitans telluris]UQX89171.1 hypothetical protein M6D93_03995 [Jatrophihabitans telluris]
MSSKRDGEWLPNICRNGHRLIPPNVLIAWLPCACQPGRSGHRTVTCQTCGAVWHKPPHVDDTRSAQWWQ